MHGYKWPINCTRTRTSQDVPHLFPDDHAIQMHWEFSANNFTAGHCDECAASYNTDFMCENVR